MQHALSGDTGVHKDQTPQVLEPQEISPSVKIYSPLELDWEEGRANKNAKIKSLSAAITVVNL